MIIIIPSTLGYIIGFFIAEKVKHWWLGWPVICSISLIWILVWHWLYDHTKLQRWMSIVILALLLNSCDYPGAYDVTIQEDGGLRANAEHFHCDSVVYRHDTAVCYFYHGDRVHYLKEIYISK